LYRGVIVAIVAIIGISMIGTGYLSGNDNDNGGGWFNKYWNSDNNWFKKSWDYFDYKKFMGFMNSGGSDNDDNDDCDDHKKDHKENYDGYKKYYDDNKNHFDKGDYKKYLDDYKKYFDNNRQGFDKTDFKQYMDYYKKFLEDNKKSFDKEDYDKYDKEYKKYSDEYPSHDDDCNDMDDNDDKTMIDKATIDFNIGIRELKENGQTYFQNIVDECIFQSEDSFAPLCIKCKFLKMDGTTVVAKGEVIELDQSYTANQEVVIPMSSVPWAAPYTPVANDVQDVDKVEITICGKNCVPTFADFTSLKHGSRQTAINNAMASSGISVSATANSGGYNEVIIFDADKTGTADTDLQVGGGKHLLIIAENLVDSSPADGLIDSPDDSANGGTISVQMATPMFLKSFVLVDHENDPNAKAIAYDSANNVIKSVTLPITGDGQFTTVFMNAANVKRLDVTFKDSGGITNIDLKCSPPDREGCTPGFWKQKQHFKFWKTYKTTDKFAYTFGLTGSYADLKIKVDNNYIKLKDATLLQALNAQGGGLNALARHAVAALLNAASGANYAFTVDEVKTMVKNAIISGSYETTKNKLETENERGCPFGDDKCDCEDKKDYYDKYYNDHKKYYDDNKKKFSKYDYKKYMDEHKKYLNDYGKYMDKSDYKMHTDYFKKFLDNNKKKFSSSDYKKYSDDHKKYSNDYKNHSDSCTCDDDRDKDHYDKDDDDKDDKDYKYKYGKDHDD